MTPLTLASDVNRSIAFLRDVVGYGLLPGETSDVESLAGLPTSLRATVLAWYWPRRGYDEGFDPFEDFAAVSQLDTTARDLHVRLRALVGERVESSLTLASLAAQRTPDEVAGAVCWRATCSGDQLLGVVKGTHGLAVPQILSVSSTLGLRYIDPLEDASQVPSWTSAAELFRQPALDLTPSVFGVLETLVESAWLKRATSLLKHLGQQDHEPTQEVSDELDAISATHFRVDEELLRPSARMLARARSALERWKQPATLTQLAEVVANASAQHHSSNSDRVVEFFVDLLAEAPSNDVQFALWAVDKLATRITAIPALADIDQGFGWLIMDRAQVSERVDRALADLGSVTEARATIRKAFQYTKAQASETRAGMTVSAPAPGTRYRALYEALATTSAPGPLLPVDPASYRIQTPTRGWVDLPPGAIRDRSWWSGSGQSSAGRPQVRAWRAAGYDTPQLETNEDGLVVAAQFPSLPGREEWIEENSEAERLARGRYTVPPVSTTPFHAVYTYDGPSVWHMDDNELTSRRVLFVRPDPSQGEDRPEQEAIPSSENDTSSDSARTDRLLEHLREHGETDRRGIEALFASEERSLSDDLEISRWLPNLLAKASRKRQIVNIGSRKQPRWVVVGSPADLAGRLTRIMEEDGSGNRVTKLKAPRLAPGEAVPGDLYRRVILHAFPHLTPDPAPPGSTLARVEKGQAFLTDEGMRAVLAGRRLTDKGVTALLHTVELKRDARWESAASAAGAFDRDPGDLEIDEAEILTAD